MQLRPWKMWEGPHDTETRECQSVLERALRGEQGRWHPGLCHLHVHLMEMAHTEKQTVLRALPSASVLRSQWPACGHLVHMASHIDVHLGRYGEAVRANVRAVEVDKL
jgi:hypothetical protein